MTILMMEHSLFTYLILVRTVQEHALRHEERYHSVTPERRDVRANDGQHFHHETMSEPAQSTVLQINH